jgi:hypothetical protein
VDSSFGHRRHGFCLSPRASESQRGPAGVGLYMAPSEGAPSSVPIGALWCDACPQAAAGVPSNGAEEPSRRTSTRRQRSGPVLACYAAATLRAAATGGPTRASSKVILLARRTTTSDTAVAYVRAYEAGRWPRWWAALLALSRARGSCGACRLRQRDRPLVSCRQEHRRLSRRRLSRCAPPRRQEEVAVPRGRWRRPPLHGGFLSVWPHDPGGQSPSSLALDSSPGSAPGPA